MSHERAHTALTRCKPSIQEASFGCQKEQFSKNEKLYSIDIHDGDTTTKDLVAKRIECRRTNQLRRLVHCKSAPIERRYQRFDSHMMQQQTRAKKDTSVRHAKLSTRFSDFVRSQAKSLAKSIVVLQTDREQVLASSSSSSSSPPTTTITTITTRTPVQQKTSLLTISIMSTDQCNILDHSHKSSEKLTNYSNESERDVDSGYAWIILAIVFVINASTFGTARAYGLIFDKLAREENQSRSDAALPFTIMGAVENMAGPLTGYMLARTGSWRLTVFIGSCLITTAHLLAALSSSLIGQLLTIGLMNGFGLSFVTISFFQVNNAYFVRYRSTAFGLGLTGAAFGALYISPLSQYFLDNYGTSACYLIMGLILFPNVPLSLLLKPKIKTTPTENGYNNNSSIRSYNSEQASDKQRPEVEKHKENLETISGQVDDRDKQVISLWTSIKQVICNPVFHLIWPTQLLFCWFNFVFGMIIVDFGKDRGLSCQHLAELIPIWAFGQLTGRMLLGSLVDLNLISYRLLTVICFTSIGLTNWSLNNIQLEDDYYNDLLVSVLVFSLSMFISNLYILFNGLVVKYMDKSVQALSIGISSFTGSFFLLPRATVIGYYRDTIGNYDSMLTLFTYAALIAGILWLVLPTIFSALQRFLAKSEPHPWRADMRQSRRLSSETIVCIMDTVKK